MEQHRPHACMIQETEEERILMDIGGNRILENFIWLQIGYNLATFHLVKYTNDEEIQEYMDTSETKYKNICISCCMFSARAAELSVPAELSRSLTNL